MPVGTPNGNELTLETKAINYNSFKSILYYIINVVNLLHVHFDHSCGHPQGGVILRYVTKLQVPMHKYKILVHILYLCIGSYICNDTTHLRCVLGTCRPEERRAPTASSSHYMTAALFRPAGSAARSIMLSSYRLMIQCRLAVFGIDTMKWTSTSRTIQLHATQIFIIIQFQQRSSYF